MMLRWRLLLLDLVHQSGASAVAREADCMNVSMLIHVWLELCDFSRTMEEQASKQRGSLLERDASEIHGYGRPWYSGGMINGMIWCGKIQSESQGSDSGSARSSGDHKQIGFS